MEINKSQKDLTLHGTVDFPLSIYDDYVYPNILNFTEWHWHEALQFCLVKHGAVWFHVNQQKVLLKAGEGIFINSKQLHKTENTQRIESYYMCFDVHPDFISSFSGSIINTHYILPIIQNDHIDFCLLKPEALWQKQILHHLEEIYTLYQKKEAELTIHILFLEIWQLLFKHHFKSLPLKERNITDERMRIIIDYVEHHYSEKIRLDDLSSLVGLTRTSFCREFQKYMGCSLFDYLLSFRLLKSIERLNSDLSITEIAYQCGFSTTSYYIEQFKKKTKMTPNYYRRFHHESGYKPGLDD